MIHVYGTHPTRPLEPGDQIVNEAAERTLTIVGVTPSLLLFDGSAPMHRHPAEGDFSQVVTTPRRTPA